MIPLAAADAYPGEQAEFTFQIEPPPLPGSYAYDFQMAITSGDTWYSFGEVASGTVVAVTFRDVPSDYWARHEIEACVRAGIVSGYDDGSYRPNLAVTREQLAVYISRALAGGDEYVPEFDETPSFPDVAEEHWALHYVEYGVEQNVVGGYEDGNYHPEHEVTRDQMAVYLARALVAPAGDEGLSNYTPGDPRNFLDVPDTGYGDDGTEPFWAYTHIEYCAEHGVVQGYEDGLYHPDEVVTRDQMAVYVARAFELPM